MAKNVLILGATGNTGKEICKELMNRSIPTSALVRSGSENKLNYKEISIINGDATKAVDVKKAISTEKFTDIIIALGSRDLKKTNIRSVGTENVLEALKSTNLNAHLHVISAYGVADSWKNLNGFERFISNLFLKSTMLDHNQQEIALIEYSGPKHIIRPTALKNTEGTQRVTSITSGKLPHNSIARADVAFYLVDSLEKEITGTHSICKSS